MSTLTSFPKNLIRELEKLYKITIPVEEYFDYYVYTLLNSNEFTSFLPKAIENLCDLENSLENYTSSSVSSYKMKKLDEMVKYIDETETYKKFNTCDLGKLPAWKSKDERGTHFLQHDKYTFVSFDLPSANFMSMTHEFDTSNELCRSWEELCKKFDLHPAIKNSKSFRQFVFGNLNPKRCQTIQQSFMTNTISIITPLLDMHKLIYISSDEIIFAITKNSGLHDVCFLKNVFMNTKIPYIFKPTIFNIEPVEEKSTKIFVKVLLDENLDIKHKQLVGCPGNQFFIYFKKYILNEPIDEKDLFFMNDKKLAKWVI